MVEGVLAVDPDERVIGLNRAGAKLIGADPEMGVSLMPMTPAQPMPTMLEPFDWKECKAFFIREAHSIVLP